MNKIPLNSDLADFLNALLAMAQNQPAEERQIDADATIHHSSPAFTDAASRFLSGFRAYAESLDLDPDAPERSFGGNVFLSLSGHGCGFWDDRGEEGDKLQAALEAFSGSRYRFESLDSELMKHENGEIDLAFIPSALEEYRAKRFSDGVSFLPD